MNFKIYTDGGFSYIDQVGSWAFVILNQDESMKIERAGIVDHHKQTSQVAEITAILKALQFVHHELCKSSPTATNKVNIEVISDSQYCVNTITEWMHGWASKNWKVDKQNLDLWRVIYELKSMFGKLTLTWVKGHSGVEYNELVDKLNQVALKEHLKEVHAK